MKAIGIIQDEHRSLAAVLHGMRYLLSEIGAGRMQPDFRLLGAMVYYIDTFPERFHHPREDAFLFARVAARCAQARPIVERLEAEHRTGAEKIRTLAQALQRYQGGGDAEFPGFRDLVEQYANFHWKHMRTEEDELMPLARAHLSPDDWRAIDEGFGGHVDPLHGATAGEYDELFKRIVTLAPPPIGVGPDARGIPPA